MRGPGSASGVTGWPVFGRTILMGMGRSFNRGDAEDAETERGDGGGDLRESAKGAKKTNDEC
jgi:hypothetical protein